MPDPSDLLSRHSPPVDADPATLDSLWRSIERPNRSFAAKPAFRWLIGGLSLGVAAAVVIAVGIRTEPPVPKASPPIPTSPVTTPAEQLSDFERLAQAAASRPGPQLADGKYLRVRWKAVDGGSHRMDHKRTVRTGAYYYAFDGALWFKDADDPDPKPFWHYESGKKRSRVEPSPAFLASLPTDPDELIKALRPAAYLADKVEWGESPKTKVQKRNSLLNYLRSAISLGYGPPEVNAALIRAFQKLTSATLTPGTAHDGRECLILTATEGYSYACLDPKTAEAIETGRSDYYVSYTSRDIIDELPKGAVKATRKG